MYTSTAKFRPILSTVTLYLHEDGEGPCGNPSCMKINFEFSKSGKVKTFETIKKENGQKANLHSPSYIHQRATVKKNKVYLICSFPAKKRCTIKHDTKRATRDSVVRRKQGRPFFGNICTRCTHPLSAILDSWLSPFLGNLFVVSFIGRYIWVANHTHNAYSNKTHPLPATFTSFYLFLVTFELSLSLINIFGWPITHKRI